MGLVLSLVISTTMAHHIVAKGWCSVNNGRAFFQTAQFANNLEVQVRFYGTTNVVSTFNTPATGSTNVTFDVAQASQNTVVKVQFRYRTVGSPGNSGWSSWEGSENNNTYTSSITTIYSLCGGLLPVRFVSMDARLIKS